MAEEFTEHVEVVAARLVLADRTQHRVEGVQQLPPGRPLCRSLKRASSRTKSSKRRLEAASSRSTKTVSAVEDDAHRNSARCARSPRSAKVRTRSVMVGSGAWRRNARKRPQCRNARKRPQCRNALCMAAPRRYRRAAPLL
jgi:hypothetical protein